MRIGLRSRVALTFAAMIFALAVVLSLVLGESSVTQLRARIGQSLATDAARIADRLNKEMAARSRELALLAAMDPLRNQADPAIMQSLLDSLRRNEGDYLWLGVTDVQGHVVTATDGSVVGDDLSTRADVRDLLRARPHADDAPRVARLADPTREEPRLITISRPIRAPDGTAVGLIVAQLGWNWARELSRTLLTPDADGVVRRQAFVVSTTDTVLIGPGSAAGSKLSMTAINRARAGIVGASVGEWPGAGSDPQLIGTAFAAGEGQFPGPGSFVMGWTVLVREAEALSFAPVQALRMTILELGLALSAIMAAAGWFIVGYITRPLRRIAAAADQLRLGAATDMPHIGGAPEIATLSASIRALVASLTSKQLKLDEMETTVQRDGLTGLMNREGLRAWLLAATSGPRATRRGLLVLVGDLDGFKAVNDTHGHAAGDALLIEVANRFRHAVRAGDAVARLGGDEFVLVLQAPSGHADQEAVETARRVWSRLMEPYVIDTLTITVGLSLGAASWPEDDTTVEAVQQKADAALYAAKRGGKAQIVFHREPVSG